ncbi:hypothetical protein Taro_045782 [Colocasia esculenta]|uniref:Uncharacterized protein n=1 Tax=Colocasia esculenta TaxID=4460 RepID=A0A843WQE7_COLES|nr:hypothetical protein [Colocasia esculenta]
MGEEKKGAGGRTSSSIGALKKPATKHKCRRRRLARSVVEYLTSDSYMYAPLLDALLSEASTCSPQGASAPTEANLAMGTKDEPTITERECASHRRSATDAVAKDAAPELLEEVRLTDSFYE